MDLAGDLRPTAPADLEGSNAIVVGVDGSPGSAFALGWAAEEAHRRGFALNAVHGLRMPVVSVPFGDAAVLPPSDKLRARATHLLDGARRRVEDAWPDVKTQTFLVLRPPAEALLAMGEEAALTVVGTRGLGALGAVVLGSVSGHVAARSTGPVVVVPPHRGAGDGSIVVGVDGSAHSDAALRFALAEADLRSARVVAVTAHHAGHVPDPGEAAAAVARARAGSGSRAEVSVRAVAGHPAEVIADAGRDATLIVVGSRGSGEVRGMLLGSTSHALLHHAPRPVAVLGRAADRRGS